MKALIRAFVALIVLVAVLDGIAAYTVARRGLSTRSEPSGIEELLARTMRRLAAPSDVRAMTHPVQPTPEVLEEGLEHFADH